MIRRILCRLMRHKHGQAVILLTLRDGGTSRSQAMDEWYANWIVANWIAPSAKWGGRDVASCRVVVL
jgi:hypothetical protein